MDGTRFDRLTRGLVTVATRRRALGSLAALFGLSTEEATAHNRVRACKQIEDAEKRRRCLKRARAHNRKHRKCAPQRKAVVCAGRCRRVVNNCGKRVDCGGCGTHQECVRNGSCGRSCALSHPPCPSGCDCEGLTVDAGPLCVTPRTSCDQFPTVCEEGTKQCPPGSVCVQTDCGPNNTRENRCISLCQA